ncbi:hypothetical protein [Cellulomonas sp. NPDC058312]|uniref:hypothetical protein n=1 Tax=Cellulomonas sp. NPDC058312 TaxID=3346441 RepID=UPI0036EF0AD1
MDLWSGEWVAAFFLSPAVTGVAAVVAATIGLRVARVRARVDRDLAAEQHRRDARAAELVRAAAVEDRDRAQWWVAFTWATERLGRGPGSRATDRLASHRVLYALAGATDDPVRSALVALAWTPDATDEEHVDDE